MIYKRPNRKQLRYNRRQFGLRAVDLSALRRVKKTLILLLLSAVVERNNNGAGSVVSNFFERAIRVYVCKYMKIRFMSQEDYEKMKSGDEIVKPHLKIVNYNDKPNVCDRLFRFEYRHLRRLHDLLKFPTACILENGSKVHSEEVYLNILRYFSFKLCFKKKGIPYLSLMFDV